MSEIHIEIHPSSPIMPKILHLAFHFCTKAENGVSSLFLPKLFFGLSQRREWVWGRVRFSWFEFRFLPLFTVKVDRRTLFFEVWKKSLLKEG